METINNTVKGFTLIELLVVIAIIGLLSTIITGPIQNGLKKGRDAKKIGDIRALKNALAQYAVDNNGVFPISVDGLVPGGYLSAVPSSAATTTTSQSKIMYVSYKDSSGNVFSYHMGVALEAPNTVLNGDADCAAAGCALSGYSSNSYSNYSVANPGATGSALTLSATSDFFGNGETAGTCSLSASQVSNCVYDIIP